MKAPRYLSAAFFPARCCVCGRVLEPGGHLCEACLPLRLPLTGGSARCPVCAMPVKDCVCGDRLWFSTLTFPFLYDGAVRAAVGRMKFRHGTDLFAPFAEEMAAALRRRGLTGADGVCFVPMQPLRRWRRGYNQAEELAKALGKELGLPVLPLLKKTGGARVQHTLSGPERRANLLGSYEVPPERERDVPGKRLLLTDDVATTCSTLNEAAKTLLIFGAARVDCVCVSARPRLIKKNGAPPRSEAANGGADTQ